LERNTAICRRVSVASGQNLVPSPQPTVMPDAFSASMNCEYWLPRRTSSKDDAAGSGADLPPPGDLDGAEGAAPGQEDVDGELHGVLTPVAVHVHRARHGECEGVRAEEAVSVDGRRLHGRARDRELRGSSPAAQHQLVRDQLGGSRLPVAAGVQAQPFDQRS
jgi:hypothetical protein